MNPLELLNRPTFADVERIGMPRALLHYRYGTLWTTFFESLGREVVLSAPTTKDIVAQGDALSHDECCLASKIFLGHVESLIGACDAVFIPSIGNLGRFKMFCTKFQALPDLVANTFAERGLRLVSCLVNELEGVGMREALVGLAAEFGATSHEARRAWKTASRAQEHAERAKTAAQNRQRLLLAHARRKPTGEERASVSILLAAHPYIAHDPFLGGELADMLDRLGATVFHADAVDREQATRESFEFSQTLPWIVNREIIGAITACYEQVDGIVLMSAFPCGPDSMTDDAIVRCMQGKPILNLTIDAQSGTAGLETRVESFIDILRYQKKGGYVHGS